MQPIFDGHNDVLSSLFRSGKSSDFSEFLSGRAGHLDLPKARSGGFVGGLFAIWVPGPKREARAGPRLLSYSDPIDARIDPSYALQAIYGQIEILEQLQSFGALRICKTADELRSSIASGVLAAVMHLEGADGISPQLDELDVLYSLGLRSLGLVWSRPNVFAEGVPFRFPSTPDTGPGLTSYGKDLVKRCSELGIMLDVSHLNERGFWDVVGVSSAPIVASHSNAHHIAPHSRNLTDQQLIAISKSKGLVGLNFGVEFLRSAGQRPNDVTIGKMVDHLDHLLSVVGENHVALGSDFDGTKVPAKLADVSGLPYLVDAMDQRGYSDVLINKVCLENWLSTLDRVWERKDFGNWNVGEPQIV